MAASDLKALLARYGITPNKALGQNFLSDDAAAETIARAACEGGLPVLEIGPGMGALTGVLLAHAPQVVAVEIDAAMVRVLEGEFAGAENLTLLHGDFLKADLTALAPMLSPRCAVAANLPYYVTTPICMRLLASALPIERMALMLQREAAVRFTAAPNERVYGPLTVLTQHYYTVEPLLSLSPASYYPQPEVDSAVLLLTRRTDAEFLPALPRVLNAAFAMRRKTIANNLRAALPTRDAVQQLLAAAGIQPTARAESLPPAAFARLAALWQESDTPAGA